MQPKKLESDATRGLVSKRKQTVSDAIADGRQRIAKYVKTIRDIREKNKKDA